MKPGEVIDSRFELEALAGAGGMGVVYRARDRSDGALVALKCLQATETTLAERFAREARLLGELSHPGIVRFVSVGRTAGSEPYLVMEWLEGEDLSRRLGRAVLTFDESIRLATRVADALGVAHARGIIHRDVKPANIFVPAGDIERVKVLDFGIARSADMSQVTATGMMVGTLAYMAPEQLRGDRDLDARVDVFALGSVLFECLTGRRPFDGVHPVAVLAKLLVHETPRLRDLRPDLPTEIDALVTRMIAKDRGLRPADGAAVARELETIATSSASFSTPASIERAAIMDSEQRVLSIIIVARTATSDVAATIEPNTVTFLQQTSDVVDEWAPVREILSSFGADLIAVGRDSALLRIAERDRSSDQTTRVARLALAIASVMPTARLAMATGLVEVSNASPVGPAIDRAVQLLDGTNPASGLVYVDDVSASLLEARFELTEERGRRVVAVERPAEDDERLLLGRRTACVGRERELAYLEAAFAESAEDSVARVVLVTGEAGIGKSRIRREFVRRVVARATTLLIARGDPVNVGSAFGLVAQLIRGAAGLRDGETRERQHAQLREWLEGLVGRDEAPRLAEFLGEIARAPSPDQPSPQLRGARDDPRIMGEQTRVAFTKWVTALTRRGPTVFVIEDTHWGDAPSIMLLDAALRAATEAPLVVLALARPEVHDALGRLWPSHKPHEIRLGALSRRAAERLTRAALGDGCDEATVARIVGRGGGNAFYLEELLRHVAENRDGTLPESVLAMADARLASIELEGRRILRAGAVFGVVFWADAAKALLGAKSGDLEGWLGTLVDREILEVHAEARFPGQREYAFRHGLYRDAAYASLVADDRTRGHFLAAEWLESHGEADAQALAEHFELGGAPQRATPYLSRAANEMVFGGGSATAVRALIERGLAHAVEGEERGWLRTLAAVSSLTTGKPKDAADQTAEALRELEVGSTRWMLAAALAITAANRSGDASNVGDIVRAVLAMTTTPPPSGPYACALMGLALGVTRVGMRELGESFIARFEVVPEGPLDPSYLGWRAIGRTYLGVVGLRLPGVGLREGLTIRDAFRDGADRTGKATGLVMLGYAQFEAGDYDGCARTCDEGAALLERGQNVGLADMITFLRSIMLSRTGHVAAALVGLEPVTQTADVHMAATAQTEVAFAHLSLGDAAKALEVSEAAANRVAVFPIARAMALAVVAAARFALGDPKGALDAARLGVEARASGIVFGTFGWFDTMLWLTRIEANVAIGEGAVASALLAEARGQLEAAAASFTPESQALRDAFLARHDNARLLAM